MFDRIRNVSVCLTGYYDEQDGWIVRLGEELLTDLILLAVHGVMLSSTSETAAFATVGTVEEVQVIFHNTPARTVSCLAMEAATAKSTLQTKQLKLEI